MHGESHERTLLPSHRGGPWAYPGMQSPSGSSATTDSTDRKLLFHRHQPAHRHTQPREERQLASTSMARQHRSLSWPGASKEQWELAPLDFRMLQNSGRTEFGRTLHAQSQCSRDKAEVMIATLRTLAPCQASRSDDFHTGMFSQLSKAEGSLTANDIEASTSGVLPIGPIDRASTSTGAETGSWAMTGSQVPGSTGTQTLRSPMGTLERSTPAPTLLPAHGSPMETLERSTPAPTLLPAHRLQSEGSLAKQISEAHGGLCSQTQGKTKQASDGIARYPQNLVEGFVAVGTNRQGGSEAAFCWPGALLQSQLTTAVVSDGFCPRPELFEGPEPAGFGASSFVFTLLETALDKSRDPNGVLYGCVGSGRRDSDSRMPTLASGTNWLTGIVGETKNPVAASCVLCIVSKLPLFDILFSVLEALCNHTDSAKSASQFLTHLNEIGNMLLSHSLEVVDLACGVAGGLKLRLPCPITTGHGGVSPLRGACLQSQKEWQASWGLASLLVNSVDLIGDTLAKLLVSVLLEQKVLLLGSVSQSSAMAITLHALLSPFRWLHPFFSAPPPPGLMEMPLLEAPMPLIVVLPELPVQWGYETVYQLPEGVVTGMLKHNYVHLSPAFCTFAGLQGVDLRFPSGRHMHLLKRIARAKKELKSGDVDLQGAVKLIYKAMECEIQDLCALVQQYVLHTSNSLELSPGEHTRTLLGEGYLAGHSCGPLTLQSQSLLRRQAADSKAFVRFLATGNAEEHCSLEAKQFYETFFQTQLCQDYVHREIDRHLSSLAGNTTDTCSDSNLCRDSQTFEPDHEAYA